jgi:hypothetical protein
MRGSIAQKPPDARRHRCGKYVSAARDGSDHFLLIVAQGIPDFGKALHQRVIGNRDVAPNGLDQFRLGHKVAVPLQQIGKYLEGFRPERDLLLASA